MRRFVAATLGVACLFVCPLMLRGEDLGLSLDDVLARARERAPVILAARRQIDEARGRLVGASVLLRDNPVVQGAAGPRRREHDTSTDLDVGISQTFELGGRRAARIDGATAGVDVQAARGDDAARRLLRDVSAAFFRAVAADERVRLARTAEGFLGDLQQVAARRYRSGDIPVLDLNLALTAMARARSDRWAAEADVVATRGALQVLLGGEVDEPLRLRGALHGRRRYDLDALLARAPERADLRELAAEVGEAEAEVRLGTGAAWPDLGVGVRYGREEGADIALGALSVTLPLFAHGQEQRATGAARASRLRFELDAQRRVVRAQVRTAFDIYQHQVAAAEELEREVLPRLDENEALSRRSYEAGQLSLPELLIIRRETLDTRRVHQDRLLDAVLAGVELEAAAGVLQ